MYELLDVSIKNIYYVKIDYNGNADIEEDDFAAWREEPRLFGFANYYKTDGCCIVQILL